MPTQVKNGTVFGYTISDDNSLKFALWATGAACKFLKKKNNVQKCNVFI
jgi:hypothetical protein